MLWWYQKTTEERDFFVKDFFLNGTTLTRKFKKPMYPPLKKKIVLLLFSLYLSYIYKPARV